MLTEKQFKIAIKQREKRGIESLVIMQSGPRSTKSMFLVCYPASTRTRWKIVNHKTNRNRYFEYFDEEKARKCYNNI